MFFTSSCGSDHHLNPSAGMTIAGDELYSSITVKNLAVLLDATLSIEDHVNHVCSSLPYYLRPLKSLRRILTRPLLVQLICFLVLSCLDYGNALLWGISSRLLDKMQRVQNPAAGKFVTESSYRDHATPNLKSIHWLPIRQRLC